MHPAICALIGYPLPTATVRVAAHLIRALTVNDCHFGPRCVIIAVTRRRHRVLDGRDVRQVMNTATDERILTPPMLAVHLRWQTQGTREYGLWIGSDS